MLAGATRIRGGRLELRRADGLVEVSAPKRFVAALFDWCDGTRPLAAIDRLAEARWGASRFPAFVRDMLRSGVLIDAAAQVELAFAAAQLPMQLGQQTSESEWEAARVQAHSGRSGLRDEIVLQPGARTPLSRLVAGRHSADSFEDRPFAAAHLSSLLSALYGVVEKPARVRARPAPLDVPDTLLRRAIPSAGGFKSLRVSLILCRGVGRVRPGVYEAVYSAAGRLALCFMGEAGNEWCRAIIDPHRWMTATGFLLISADPAAARLKYLGRALPFVLIEAGAMLQNGSLAAVEHGFGFRLLGGYYADRMASVCKIPSGQVLCSAVFGVPAHRDLESPKGPGRRHRLSFQWMPDMIGDGSHVARAQVRDEPLPGHGWGRAADPATACAIAVSEAVERYAFVRLGTCIEARAGGLEGKLIDPRSIALYAPAQYRNPALGVHAFEPRRSYLWARAERCDGRGGPAWVPAEFVWAAAAIPPRHARFALTRVSTSGCATDVDFGVAVERATYELIERDAFARHWLAQLRGVAVRLAGCPNGLRQRVRKLQDEQCTVAIVLLEASLGPVVLVAIESAAQHFSAVGTACGADFNATVDRAFDEAEVIAMARLRQERVAPIRASDVKRPMDHSALYAQARHFRRARVLTETTRSTSFRAALAAWPQTLDGRLRSAASSAPPERYCVDMSAAGAPRDPWQRELRTVRVILPGTIAIGFGADALPRGTLDIVSPARFPHPLA